MESSATPLSAMALVKTENDCQIIKPEKISKDEQTYNIFVGDLPLDATDDDLYKTFRPCGIITSAKVIRRNGHRTKLYGFVNFKSQKGMDKACDEFQGFEVKGSCIVVKRQHSSTEKSTKGKNEFDCFQSVFVGNLPRNITEKKLKHELMGIIGPCFSDVRMKNGYGFVLFETIKGAHEAIKKLDGKIIINQPCKAQFVRTRDEQNYVQHGGDPEELLRHRRTLLVTNIPQRAISVEDLRIFFSNIGHVTNTYIPPQGSEHVYGFVEFSNLKDAALAMVKRQYHINGHLVDVALSKPRAEPQSAQVATNSFKDVMLPQLESFLQNQAHMIGPQQQHLLGQMQSMNGPMFEMLAKFFYGMGQHRTPQQQTLPAAPTAMPQMSQIPQPYPQHLAHPPMHPAHLQHPPPHIPQHIPPQGSVPMYPPVPTMQPTIHPPPVMNRPPSRLEVAPDASRSDRHRRSSTGSSGRRSRRDSSPRRSSSRRDRDRDRGRDRAPRDSRKPPPAPTHQPPVSIPMGWNVAVPAAAKPQPDPYAPQHYTPQQNHPAVQYSYSQQTAPASWPPLPGQPANMPPPGSVTPQPPAAAPQSVAPWQTYNPAVHSTYVRPPPRH